MNEKNLIDVMETIKPSKNLTRAERRRLKKGYGICFVCQKLRKLKSGIICLGCERKYPSPTLKTRLI